MSERATLYAIGACLVGLALSAVFALWLGPPTPPPTPAEFCARQGLALDRVGTTLREAQTITTPSGPAFIPAREEVSVFCRPRDPGEAP